MNSLVTLLVLTLAFLLAISFANSPAAHSGNSATSHQPSTSTAPSHSTPPEPALSPSPIPSVPGSYAVAYPPEAPSSPPPQAPSVSPPSPSPTPSLSPSVLDEQVFIPLKEWKQRKLQHIELHVRNGQARPSPSPHPSPRDVAKCPLSRRHLPITLFTRVCFIHDTVSTPNNISESNAFYASTTKHDYAPSDTPNTQALGATHTQIPKYNDSPSSTQSHPSSHNQFSPSSPSATANHANIPIRVATSYAPSNLPVDDRSDSDPSGRAGLNLPLRLPKVVPNFGTIVRSLIDASYLFSATPLPSSFTIKPYSHSSHKLTTSNNTNSSSTQRAQDKDRTHSYSTNSKKLSNSKTSSIDRSSPVETPVTSSPFPNHVLIQHNLQGAKEKPFNFASADAGARVLAYSKGVVGAKNVLIGSVDKYLLAPCDGYGLMGSRWIDVELSEDVILESIETANFEYYSSCARKVAVLGASSYPPKRWNILGVFDFRNVKSIQRFQISKRVVTRFLRVMYSGKQGDAYYCPVSTIRAFGKNLIADWKDVFEERTPEDNQVQSDSRKSEDERVGNREVRDEYSYDDREPGEVRLPTNPERPNVQVDENLDQRACSHSDTSGGKQKDSDASDSGTVTRNTLRTSDRSGYETDDDAADAVQGDHDRQSGSSAIDEREDTDANGVQPLTDEEVQPADGDLISEDDRIVIEAVRTDALAPVSVEDNIFRKVTRMLRLLELNQTLTNQYIDSQLSRFARALASTHSRSGAVDERVANVEKQMMQIIVNLEARVDDLLQASFMRDVVISVLLITLAVLVGAHCVLWAAVSGTRLQYVPENREIKNHPDSARVATMFRTEEVGSPITTKDAFPVDGVPLGNKRRKRKMKKPFASARKERSDARKPEGQDTDDQNGRHARSASSVELVSLPLTTQTLPLSRGAFEVLGSSEEN